MNWYEKSVRIDKLYDQHAIFNVLFGVFGIIAPIILGAVVENTTSNGDYIPIAIIFGYVFVAAVLLLNYFICMFRVSKLKRKT